MKKQFLCILFMFLAHLSVAQDADAIIGIWEIESGESHVQIYKKEGQYFGKIHWIKNPKKRTATDKNNPDPQFRNRSILGLEIITDLQYKGGEWVNGKIYSPERGSETPCKFSLESSNQLKITVSKGFMSKGQTWKRVK
ncbi:MAG: DUF2147 domain-containing protein [Bacteroidia bacterium]|nr:DUF2147 domain-containing protein [Bacteroidia bacterium]